LHLQQAGTTREVVLRIAGGLLPEHIATGAAALAAAEEYGVAAPHLIASDLDGSVAGIPATLETFLQGSSDSLSRTSPERLQLAGAAIAKVHSVQLQPRPHLPRRTRSGEFSDRPRQRRWSTLYRASAADERPAVVDAFSELTGWPGERAQQAITATHSTPLLQLADDRLRELPVPQREAVLVHGDVWAGNMIWNDDTVTLIDWKVAGVGDPGIDLGRLRMQMAMQYGPEAAAHVLAGWEAQAGRRAPDLAYWDAVAALGTPADLTDWTHCVDEDGNQLSTAERTKRRDTFLRVALDNLEQSPHRD
jgi:aminoglycoside phosphotransferase (APT) family kinase protein